MIQIDLRKGKSGVPILSKSDIEVIGEAIIRDYNPRLLDEPAALDVDDFSECYAELEMDFQDLTHDQSILGMTVFNNCYIPVYDAELDKAKRISVSEGTVIIDNSLLEDDQLRRGRFTVGHEVSHWVLHRGLYTVNTDQLSLFDDLTTEREPVVKCRSADIENRGKKRLVTDEDFMEWQADYMASALLMPKSAFYSVADREFQSMGIKGGCYQVGSDWQKDLWLDALVYDLADIFEVSATAARIRLKNLGFIRDGNDNQQRLLV